MATVTSGTLNSYSYTYYATVQSSNGKIAMPVQPSQVIFSQLEHITGYAAPNSEGISINKIHLLNSLITQAIDVKADFSSQSKLAQSLASGQISDKNDLKLSEAQIDTLVKEFKTALSASENKARLNPYALTPAKIEGLAVNFLA